MNDLKEIQAKKQDALNVEISLENKFTQLTGGITPHVICPENKPFVVFYPKTREDYLTIFNNIEPTDNAKVTFAGKAAIDTFSPYLVTYGGKHDTPNYMEVCVKFNSSICPVLVKMPDEVKEAKFSVSTMDGKHKGFGRYERLYTLQANEGKTTIQVYYGDNKTMYAANEDEANKLFDFITL